MNNLQLIRLNTTPKVWDQRGHHLIYQQNTPSEDLGEDADSNQPDEGRPPGDFGPKRNNSEHPSGPDSSESGPLALGRYKIFKATNAIREQFGKLGTLGLPLMPVYMPVGLGIDMISGSIAAPLAAAGALKEPAGKALRWAWKYPVEKGLGDSIAKPGLAMGKDLSVSAFSMPFAFAGDFLKTFTIKPLQVIKSGVNGAIGGVLSMAGDVGLKKAGARSEGFIESARGSLSRALNFETVNHGARAADTVVRGLGETATQSVAGATEAFGAKKAGEKFRDFGRELFGAPLSIVQSVRNRLNGLLGPGNIEGAGYMNSLLNPQSKAAA
jgi:hypothetical protein